MIRGWLLFIALTAVGLIILVMSQETHAQAPAHLVINEIFDSATPGNEYFELYNGTSQDVDLSDYSIYSRNGANALDQLNQPVIRAGAFKAIGATELGGSIGITSGLQTEADFLALVQTGSPDQVIDLVNWGAPNPNWANFQRFHKYFFSTPLSLYGPDTPFDLQRFPDGYDTNSAADFAFLISSPGAPSCADPYEPDNISYGQPLIFGQTQLHRICGAADADYIHLTLQNTISYTFQISNVGAALNPVLTLYGQDGVPVITTTTGNEIRYQPGFSGQYTVEVKDRNGGGGAGADWLYTVALGGLAAPTPTATPTSTPQAFSDVQPGDYFYEAVRFLTATGAVSGYKDPARCPSADACFLPFNNTTRGQLTKIVILAARLPAPVPTNAATSHFADVPLINPFYSYIEQAAATGIVSGYDSHAICGAQVPCFLPFNEVTRGQLAKIIVQARRWNKVVVEQPTFSDVPADSVFYPYVEIAACHGVISGYGDGTFRPGNTATRGQIAKVVYQAQSSSASCAGAR